MSNGLKASRESTYDASASNPVLTGHGRSAVATDGKGGLPSEREVWFAGSIGCQLPRLQRSTGVAEAVLVQPGDLQQCRNLHTRYNHLPRGSCQRHCRTIPLEERSFGELL